MILLPMSEVRHCSVCDVEWKGNAPCWTCGGAGAQLTVQHPSSVDWMAGAERVVPSGVLTL